MGACLITNSPPDQGLPTILRSWWRQAVINRLRASDSCSVGVCRFIILELLKYNAEIKLILNKLLGIVPYPPPINLAHFQYCENEKRILCFSITNYLT